MFQRRQKRGTFDAALEISELVFHSIVRSVRTGHRSPIISLLIVMAQAMALLAVFMIMMLVLDLQRNKLRGDFILYIMSGIFMFMTHTKAVSAVATAAPANSGMNQHAPLNTLISILSAAFGSLYLQALSLILVLFMYHVLGNSFTIYDPVSAFAMFLLAWGTGVGVGMVFLALRSWVPGMIGIIRQTYQRLNMLASGKMFLANTMPSAMLAMFDWNPLFHCIDQGRGYIFANYFPRNSSWEYAVYVGLALIALGLLGEYYANGSGSKVRGTWR